MRFLPRLRFALLPLLGSMVLAPGLFAADLPGDDGPWTPLFDGKTLSGWTQYGGKAPFTIEDDVIVGTYVPEKTNSFLATKKEYADFVFEVDFKANGVKGVNSGVQFRSHTRPENDGISRVFGYQAEIDPVEPAKTGGVYEEAARGWLADLRKSETGEKVKAAFRPSEWNTLRIQAVGDHIQTWVNGVPGADFHDATQASGFIALQVHAVGSPLNETVRFRNPRIRTITAAPGQ
jgi:hypothetical protein